MSFIQRKMVSRGLIKVLYGIVEGLPEGVIAVMDGLQKVREFSGGFVEGL